MPLPRTEEKQDGAPLEITKNDLDNAWISARTTAGNKDKSIVCKKNGERRTGGDGSKDRWKERWRSRLLVHPKIQSSIHSHEVLSARIAVLRLRTEKKATITIVNCYAPNSVASEEDKDNFYAELESVVEKEKSYYMYICGDFNALVGNGSDGNWRLGRHGNETRNDNGFRLLDLMSSCNLFHGNSIFEKPQHRRLNLGKPERKNPFRAGPHPHESKMEFDGHHSSTFLR
ncbi:hypothetical protein Y032_0737g1949 [Ancylostoma ceylanicum]|uniref:Endonuclease/exonuclease/phosphatase domain-containing protein n=1 Tax=Ancylostoma ceylanicum TaxID=53326 RepID=A0A016WFW7_9BILA|nr:hypothetical protein Y032_0737g1949 [Ancylostoma ceylanicum]